MYRVTKTFPHSLGLSVAFRQWRATSHCSKVHGYALEIDLGLICEELDERNWCFDFGAFKEVLTWLKGWFDHKLIVAEDDPLKDMFIALAAKGGADVALLPQVGCEAFAKFIHDNLAGIISVQSNNRVQLGFVAVREHGANAAIYAPSL